MRGAEGQRMHVDAANIAIVLRGVAYHIEDVSPIAQIPALASDTALHDAFKNVGYANYAHSRQTLAEQAVSSAKKTLAAANIAASDVDAIVLGTSELLEQKRYPEFLSTEVLMALELTDVPLVGVTLAGCANYSSCLRVARNMVVAEGMRNVLVIETDQVRGSMQRQLVFDGNPSLIFGDGAVSVVVSAEPRPKKGWFGRKRDTKEPDRALSSDVELLAMSQTIRPIDYGNSEVNAIAYNNLLGFQRVLDEVLLRAGVARTDFAQIFMSNINPAIVLEIAEGLELPSNVYTTNSGRIAHIWSCDNLINLADYCAAEAVPPGALFLMICWAESYFSAIVCRKR